MMEAGTEKVSLSENTVITITVSQKGRPANPYEFVISKTDKADPSYRLTLLKDANYSV